MHCNFFMSGWIFSMYAFHLDYYKRDQSHTHLCVGKAFVFGVQERLARRAAGLQVLLWILFVNARLSERFFCQPPSQAADLQTKDGSSLWSQFGKTANSHSFRIGWIAKRYIKTIKIKETESLPHIGKCTLPGCSYELQYWLQTPSILHTRRLRTCSPGCPTCRRPWFIYIGQLVLAPLHLWTFGSLLKYYRTPFNHLMTLVDDFGTLIEKIMARTLH